MDKCEVARKFSKGVYNFLTDVFSYRLGFSELGITDFFIYRLVKYKRKFSDSSFYIYKLPPNIESIYGNDIDLFVQQSSGLYVWYALQAKVMSYNSAFEDITIKKMSTQQWDKLLKHEKNFYSKTYYLLYSGASSISTRIPSVSAKKADCLGIPVIDELGLGVVETRIIKGIRERTIKPSPTVYGKFYFKYIFPDYIESVRKLFCCDCASASMRGYDRDEIETDRYIQIGIQDGSNDEIINDMESESGIEYTKFARYRIIINNV